MRALFKGGIHPSDAKEATAGLPIRRMPPPEKVYVHLSQHIGAPAVPLVSRGDEVTVGQPIGRPEGFISAAVHSPVTGKVLAVADWPHPVTGRGAAVHIQKTADDIYAGEERPDLGDLTAEELVRIVGEAGLTGLGGASFPTHVKVSPPPKKLIDTLLINGAECEPRLTADDRLMVERGEEIVRGVELLKKMLGVERCILGIEDNKPRAVKSLTPHLERAGVELAVLPTRYPQGGEKQLILAILGREVPPPPGLPLDVGVVVQNVGTALAVFEAAARGKPLMERVVTVSGAGVAEPGNILAPVGTTFASLVEFCGGLISPPGKVVMGGPMMGISQHNLEASMLKGTSGLLFFDEDQAGREGFMACISCGRCVKVCPVNLLPNILGTMVERENLDSIDSFHPEDCMECGCCSYSCPSKRPLVQFLKLAKADQAARRARARAAMGGGDDN